MIYLGDTNVVSRFVLPDDPLHSLVRDAIFELQQRGDLVCVTPQVLVEFQALATRPIEANGLGLTTAQASDRARQIEALYPLLDETPDIYVHWRLLVDAFDVKGRQVYDARLAAVMLAHKITHLLTLNPTHFRRFTGITTVEPQEVIGAPPP